MIIRPRGVHHTKCAHQVITSTYHPPRITIGPDTRSLIVELQRGSNTGWSTQAEKGMTIDLQDEEGNQLHSYAVTDGKAYFNLATTTLFAKKGLHKARLFFEGACIGFIEIIKAPGFSAISAVSTESECAEDEWCEPENNATACEDKECYDPCELEGCPKCNTPTPCETLVEQRCPPKQGDPIIGGGYV